MVVHGDTTEDDLIAAVATTGYTASRPAPPEPTDEVASSYGKPPATGGLRPADGPGGPSVDGAALQLDRWQWIAFVLATPVVVWGGWPFHRAAWVNLARRHHHGHADQPRGPGRIRLVGLRLFFGSAGMVGVTMDRGLLPPRGESAGSHLYLEAASAITVLVLAGRYAEARARRRSGDALRSLLALGAHDVTVVRDGAETTVSIDQLHVGDVFVVRPGEKVATDGVVVEGTSAVDASMLTGEPVPLDVTPGSPVVGATINVAGGSGSGDPRGCRPRSSRRCRRR